VPLRGVSVTFQTMMEPLAARLGVGRMSIATVAAHGAGGGMGLVTCTRE
jgi:hypothetical protein